MKNNPWYDESLGQAHFDPNAQLRQMQTHWYQQQESDRLFQLNQQAHGGFAGLQNVAQQYAPQQHHQQGGGVPWGGIAAGAAAGYYLANRVQQEPQPAVIRPKGWKSNVIGWYIVAAFVLQFVLAMVINPDLLWVIGFIVWIPAWFAGIMHQLSVSQHNRHLSD